MPGGPCISVSPYTAHGAPRISPGATAGYGVALGGAYSLGEAIGTLIFGDVDAAMPWANKGIEYNNAGISYYNKSHDCRCALPLFQQAVFYLEQAHRMVPINISFNTNLDNARKWLALCHRPNLAKPEKRPQNAGQPPDPKIENVVDEARKAHVQFDPFDLFARGMLLAEAPKCVTGSPEFGQNCVDVPIQVISADATRPCGRIRMSIS